MVSIVQPRPGPVTHQGPDRQRWADVAKGVCILLVVLWHVVMKSYLRIDWRLPVPLPGAWGTLGDLLLPLRMPLFFVVSGMFAAAALHRPWRTFGRARIARHLWLYVLWLLVHTALFAATPGFPTDSARTPAELLTQLTVTPSNLWYLPALALYAAIARLTRRLPAALVLAPALALSAATSGGLLDAPGNRAGLYANLVFFLAGVHGRPLVERLAAAATGRRLVLWGAAFAAALAATTALPVPWARPGVSVLAVAWGVTGAALLARTGPPGRPGRVAARAADGLAGLGRRTLPVYVLHMPVVAVLDLALRGPVSGAGAAVQVIAAGVLPVVLTVGVVWACLAAHDGLRRSGPAWLFDLPGAASAQGRHRRPA